MQVADLQVIKDIPGFKVILKAILKSQIQTMVEQLAEYTGEESVLLTASVSDGSLSHLGSESGKVFLEDHDDIKSQFLGFCLKRYHRQKQLELTSQDEILDSTGGLRTGLTSPRKFGPGSKQRGLRVPNVSSPQVGALPVSLVKSRFKPVRGTPKSTRHDPYPVNLPRSSTQRPLSNENLQSVVNLALDNIQNESVEQNNGNLDEIHPSETRETVNVKVEAVDEDSQGDEQSETFTDAHTSSHSPHHQYSAQKSSENSEFIATKSGLKSPPMVTSDSQELRQNETELVSGAEPELSNMSRPSASGDSDCTPYPATDENNLEIKIEALSESDMELEITGVEEGKVPQVSDNWVSNIQDMIGSLPEGPGGTNQVGITPGPSNIGSSPAHQNGPSSAHHSSPNSAQPLMNSEGEGRWSRYNSDHKKAGFPRLLPESATQVMKAWLFRNIMNPYPPEDVKREMARQTNLNLVQVNNWFTNARRRIIQPMLDANNTDEAIERLARYTSHHRTWNVGLNPEGGDRQKTKKMITTMVSGSNPSPIEYVRDDIRPRYDPMQPDDLSTGNKT